MSTTKHPLEPRVHVGSDGRLYFGPTPSGRVIDIQGDAVQAYDARCRIIACVNACAGLEDPAVLQAVLEACRKDLRRYESILRDEAERAGMGFVGLDSLRALGGK